MWTFYQLQPVFIESMMRSIYFLETSLNLPTVLVIFGFYLFVKGKKTWRPYSGKYIRFFPGWSGAKIKCTVHVALSIN